MFHKKANIVFVLLFPTLLVGQIKDTLFSITTQEIVFKDLRYNQKTPLNIHKDSVSLLDIFQSNFDNLLNRLPGVLATNGENLAQDIRISMRGFGSRSSFGIRGIKIFQDGIPLTSPDGTTQMDELSLYNIYDIEVLKSNMGARLGNAGGGTIALHSTPYFDGVSISSRMNTLGAYDAGFKLGNAGEKIKNVFSINHHFFESKRNHSSGKNTVLYNKTFFNIKKNWNLESILNVYDSPLGQDPGALTISEFNINPFQANIRNLMFDAGEEVRGLLAAVKSDVYCNEKNNWNTLAFYKNRNFTGRLPFQSGGTVEIFRNFYGLTNIYDYRPNQNHWISLGQNIEFQADRRKRFENVNGTQGTLDLDQNENVTNISFFQQWRMTQGRFELHQLLRYDIYKFELSDHYFLDGLQDGVLWFDNLNGSLGLGINIFEGWNMFFNVGTAFEVPTLNEFTNNPTLQGGFNPTLKPEKSFQFELGNKLSVSKNFDLNSSVFWIHVSDLISGYEIMETPGRTYYRNASQVRRAGFELSGLLQLQEHFRARFQYEYAHFYFKEYSIGNQNLSNNIQPIIPKHKIVLFLDSTIKDYINGSFSFVYQSGQFLDDMNLVKSVPLYSLNITLSSGERISKKIITGIVWNNLFNLNSFSNFRANAAFARYYEAASPSNISLFIRYNISFLKKQTTI